MKKNGIKEILLIVFAFLILLSIIYIPKIIKRNRDDINNGPIELKESYGVNEYIPVYVNDKQMSIIYFKDFLNMLLYDIDGSYDLLDKDYRDRVFENIYNYKDYIYNLKLSLNTSIVKYAVYERGNYKYYDLYDSDGHRFIFKTNGVLQYKVYFDDIDKGEE